MPAKKIPVELLRLLSDGEFHSGEAVGELLGVSRAAVWKKLQLLEPLGVEVESIKGKGYRLAEPILLLDADKLTKVLKWHGLNAAVNVHHEIDSTNAELMRLLSANKAQAGTIVVAESQLAGRGRRGRPWVSPFAQNLYFSMSWNFNGVAAALAGLSLVVGLSLVQALQEVGVDQAQLKWPNDVLVGRRKLAGVLLEMTGDATGLCHVVIGIGVNVNMHSATDEIDQPWISIKQLLGRSSDRTELVKELLDKLIPNLQLFEQQGFVAFAEQWQQYDAFSQQEVVVSLGEQRVFGIAQGVSHSGELQVQTDQGLRLFNGGEVSLRLNL